MQDDRRMRQLLAAVQAEQFELAVQLVSNPKSFGDSLRRLGDILHRARHYPEAIACYDAALRQTPRPWEAVHNRAVSCKSLGDLDQAEAGFQTVIALNPDTPAPYQQLAEVYFIANRFDEAIACLDKALSFGDDRLLQYRRNKAVLARDNRLEDPAEVFGAIYAYHAWGNDDPNRKFYSGEGSHAPETVKTYVDAVSGFLAQFAAKPDVVDIGCGDFNIGSRLYDHCGRYLAFDVVPALIAHNAQAFRHTGVIFDVLDITREAPPACDVMFIREVFQHLSNAQILRALANIEGRYKHLVFTEVEPKGAFIANKDKPSGENVRVNLCNSAVSLREPPFNLAIGSQWKLCSVDVGPYLIRTNVYTPA